MALRWVDGFESYSSLINFIQYRYASFTGPSATFVPGRAVGNALQFNGTSFITPNLGNQATYIVGFAFKNVNLGVANVQMPLLTIQDTTTTQVSMTFNPSTRLCSLYSGATLLGTGTFVMTVGAWYYLELSATIGNAGSATSKVNTVTDVTFSGNTMQSLNSYANTIGFRGPAAIGLGGSYQIDDIYINDATGAANNTFLGDMKVEPVVVIDTGNSTQWGVNVPGTPNYQAVQVLNDGLYISSNTATSLDLYLTSSLNYITSNIAGVSANYWNRNTDSTVHSFASAIRQSAVNYFGTTTNVTNTAFNAYSQIWEQDPSTAAPWTVNGVGTAEFGIKLIS